MKNAELAEAQQVSTELLKEISSKTAIAEKEKAKVGKVKTSCQQQAEEIGAVKADAKRPYFLTPARQHTAARAGALRLPPARHPLVRPGHRARRSRARAPAQTPRSHDHRSKGNDRNL